MVDSLRLRQVEQVLTGVFLKGMRVVCIEDMLDFLTVIRE